MSAPSFDKAVSNFRQFLESQGWPTEIAWARTEDLVWQSGVLKVRTCVDTEARDRYEEGRRAGLGVLLDARCILAGQTCASVGCPSDEDEAARLMYPSDGSLKLSVAVPQIEAWRVEAPDSDG